MLQSHEMNMRPCVENVAQMIGFMRTELRVVYVISISNVLNSRKTSFMPQTNDRTRLAIVATPT